MKKIWLRGMLFLLLLLLILPIQTFAVESVTVQIPFLIENASSTVVIEAVDGAPLPEKTQLTDVFAGTFEMAYSQPGDYSYTIYQKPGAEPDVTYDSAIYHIVVSVFVNEDGTLYAAIAVGMEGNPSKPGSIVFTNRLPEPTIPPSGEEIPGTGDDSELILWSLLAAASLLLLALTVERSKSNMRAKPR